MPRLPGIDNRTMHTSYGNAIYLKDSPEETRKKVMQMYTDPTRLRPTDPGHVEGNPVFTMLDVFDPATDDVEGLKEDYRAGKVGDVAIKQRLAEVINQKLEPLRERRMELAKEPEVVMEILRAGTERARPIARETLEKVFQHVGLSAGLQLSPRANFEAGTPKGVFC